MKIETDRLLPDVILVDIAPEQPLVIFIEVAATAGWITEARKGAFSEMMAAAQFARNQVAFVSAFQDRDAPAFKRALPNLAWGTFAWCVNEPEHLIMFDGSAPARSKLLSDFDFSFQPMAEDKLS